MKKAQIFVTALIALFLVFAFATLAFKSDKAEQASQTVTQNREALVRFHSPSAGDAQASVHIVEFLDPACETCRDFYPLVKEMMAANPGRIRLSVRYAPFHQGSDQVVAMLEAARRQNKFWEALEALMGSQQAWVQQHVARPELAWNQLSSIGLDMERLKNDMSTPDVERIIRQDLADAQTLNVTKTPEFFVNGKPLPSFGYKQLKQLVDEALAAS